MADKQPDKRVAPGKNIQAFSIVGSKRLNEHSSLLQLFLIKNFSPY
jgi:hypothetical protein